MHLLDKFYTRHADLVDSTAAARLNGYAGQNGTKAQLSRELQSFGVSEEGKKVLKKLVGKYRRLQHVFKNSIDFEPNKKQACAIDDHIYFPFHGHL
jgi:hypothetical protein